MNIIEEVKKMDKIPVELIKAIAKKVGNGNGWREENEERGVWVIVVEDERTMSAFSGTGKQLLYAHKVVEELIDEHPEVKAVLEISGLLKGLMKDEEEDE